MHAALDISRNCVLWNNQLRFVSFNATGVKGAAASSHRCDG